MMHVGTWLYTRLFGELVGKDDYGNRYYRSRKSEGKHIGKPGTERRWVNYKGMREPSKVPPEWHGWLHFIVDTPPTEQSPKVHTWQKEHIPNLTGTDNAYRPPGHVSQGGKRDKATGDYEPWKPN